MGRTRVDLLHLLEDLRDAYAGDLEETIVAETVANALDSGARRIEFAAAAARTLTILDDGRGMTRARLRRYHDLADPAATHHFIATFMAKWGEAREGKGRKAFSRRSAS